MISLSPTPAQRYRQLRWQLFVDDELHGN